MICCQSGTGSDDPSSPAAGERAGQCSAVHRSATAPQEQRRVDVRWLNMDAGSENDAKKWRLSGALHMLFQELRSRGPGFRCGFFPIAVRAGLIAEGVGRPGIRADLNGLVMFLSRLTH